MFDQNSSRFAALGNSALNPTTARGGGDDCFEAFALMVIRLFGSLVIGRGICDQVGMSCQSVVAMSWRCSVKLRAKGCLHSGVQKERFVPLRSGSESLDSSASSNAVKLRCRGADCEPPRQHVGCWA